jgi:hypothetical protein
MPQPDGTRSPLPLALQVLRDELQGLDAGFAALAKVEDGGERAARRSDLLRGLDRYLRLEHEVFHPVLARKGIEHGEAVASHDQLRAALAEIGGSTARTQSEPQGALDSVRSAFCAHCQVQEQSTFPRAARELGEELPGLAVELQEVRSRMKGAYGV